MIGKRKLLMFGLYVVACCGVTVLSVVLSPRDQLAAVLVASAGWCGGLSAGLVPVIWGNVREHGTRRESKAILVGDSISRSTSE